MDGGFSNSWFYVVFDCYIFLFQCMRQVMIGAWILAILITIKVAKILFNGV